jgi:cyanophycin synthetase
MNKLTVQLDTPQWYAGCSGPLNESTVVFTVHIPFSFTGVQWRESRCLECVRELMPQDPLSGVGADDWPTAFLMKGQANQSVGAWVVALCVALQRWARDPVWQGAILQEDMHILRLAIPWQRKAVARQALIFALRWVVMMSGVVTSQHPKGELNSWHDEVQRWLLGVQQGGLAPNTLRFVQAAHQRQIPFHKHATFVRLGWGMQVERLDSSFTGRTPALAVRVARKKHVTSQLLASAGVPVPRFALVATAEQALGVANQLGWPVVIKPSNQDQGTAVVPDIHTPDALYSAFAAAHRHSPGAVMLEKHVPGHDYRLLVVGGQLRMATHRVPAGVIGDGRHTIAELIDQTNADPQRGNSKRSLLMCLTLDEEALHCLEREGLTPEFVLEPDRYARLRRTANIGTGGTAADVSHVIHPDNARLAERAARIIGLDIAGVDFLCPDITRSWQEVGGAICEVNAQPGFRVHWLGDPRRDINAEVVDWLFRDKPARIPTAAISGTNGKSTVAMMLHHIWLSHGRTSGVTTTSGVWVGRERISQDNLSGLPGARMLQSDPAVEAMVIELPRKGLITFGHPCDRYDVAALLNVQDDHIGVDGIRTPADMARLKGEVLERASETVVINAEDALCLAMRGRAGTKRHVLVGRTADVPAIQIHRAEGGETLFVQTQQGVPWIILAEGAAQTSLMPLHDIPATMDGLLKFNEINALFAVALAWAQGLPLDVISQAMASFHNSPEQNPGRYNFIDGLSFEILLDYGHNPEALHELCALVLQRPVSGRRILMNQKLGNRHRAHFTQMAPLLKQTFDQFVLSCDPEYVEKCKDYAGDNPVATMLDMCRLDLLEVGVNRDGLTLQAQQHVAVTTALVQAQPGDLLVLLAEPWVALPLIKQWQASQVV